MKDAKSREKILIQNLYLSCRVQQHCRIMIDTATEKLRLVLIRFNGRVGSRKLV